MPPFCFRVVRCDSSSFFFFFFFRCDHAPFGHAHRHPTSPGQSFQLPSVLYYFFLGKMSLRKQFAVWLVSYRYRVFFLGSVRVMGLASVAVFKNQSRHRVVFFLPSFLFFFKKNESFTALPSLFFRVAAGRQRCRCSLIVGENVRFS